MLLWLQQVPKLLTKRPAFLWDLEGHPLALQIERFFLTPATLITQLPAWFQLGLRPGTCWDCSVTLDPHLLHSFPTNVQAKDQLFSAEGPDFLLSPGITRGPFTLNFTSLYLAE